MFCFEPLLCASLVSLASAVYPQTNDHNDPLKLSVSWEEGSAGEDVDGIRLMCNLSSVPEVRVQTNKQVEKWFIHLLYHHSCWEGSGDVFSQNTSACLSPWFPNPCSSRVYPKQLLTVTLHHSVDPDYGSWHLLFPHIALRTFSLWAACADVNA